jgi:hypothetical protein
MFELAANTSSASLPVGLVDEAKDLRESLDKHLLISEGRQYIANGDKTINLVVMESDTIDMDRLWTALDQYAHAAGLGRTGRDLETEAMAIAARGKVFARIIRGEIGERSARRLCKHAIELVSSL